MLLKNLINKIPNHLKGLSVKGLEINSKKVKKGFIFFAIKGKNLMVKILLIMPFKMAHL